MEAVKLSQQEVGLQQQQLAVPVYWKQPLYQWQQLKEQLKQQLEEQLKMQLKDQLKGQWPIWKKGVAAAASLQPQRWLPQLQQQERLSNWSKHASF